MLFLHNIVLREYQQHKIVLKNTFDDLVKQQIITPVTEPTPWINVFACQHFDAYIFGREIAQVEMDHKSLVSIVHKPLNKAPSLLQRMLLKLQRYNLKIKYKEGKYMFVVDRLSRAYLPTTNNEFVHSLEKVDHGLSIIEY